MRTFTLIAACIILVLSAACEKPAPEPAAPAEKVSEKKAEAPPAEPAAPEPAAPVEEVREEKAEAPPAEPAAPEPAVPEEEVSEEQAEAPPEEPESSDEPELQITDLVAKSEGTYEVVSPVVGDNIYVDRTHTYTEIPEDLKGAFVIKPANEDKIAEGEEFLSFSVNQPVTLYVAHDDRIEEKPAWLGEFTRTDMEVKTSIESLRLWVRKHPAGEIKLGVNGTDRTRPLMYLVFIRASGGTK